MQKSGENVGRKQPMIRQVELPARQLKVMDNKQKEPLFSHLTDWAAQEHQLGMAESSTTPLAVPVILLAVKIPWSCLCNTMMPSAEKCLSISVLVYITWSGGQSYSSASGRAGLSQWA